MSERLAAPWRTTLKRWLKFSMVGVMGVGVQLGVLATLTSFGLHYLVATALAVETAVLHNFIWHQNFTWGDRSSSGFSRIFSRLARFNLTTGGISIGGNLVLMGLLVGLAGLPVLVGNIATIACCSLANFLVSDRMVFLPAWSQDVATAAAAEQVEA